MNTPLISPEHMVLIAFVVGGTVRILKTKTFGELLDWFPSKYVHAIPKDALPWLALCLAAGVSVLDGHFNYGTPWKESLWTFAQGIFSGSLAIAGHETVAKKLGSFMKKAGPPATMVLALLSAFMALPTTGCAAIMSLLPHVIAVVVEAGQILDQIEAFVKRYFMNHPDQAKEIAVAKAVAKARSALNFVMRTTEGADKLDQAKVDAAFEDFKKAYLELMALCRPFGVYPESAPLMTSNADGAVLVVPEPLALHPKVK